MEERSKIKERFTFLLFLVRFRVLRFLFSTCLIPFAYYPCPPAKREIKKCTNDKETATNMRRH